MTWRAYADWAKRWPALIKLAEPLSRGYGRLRPFDRLFPPPPEARVKPDLHDWHDRPLSAVWIGHATVLLRIGGMTILTDPVFSDRIGLCTGFATIGPQRLVRPALSIRQLPAIDLIIVSHAHFDHLDRPSLRQLDRRTPVITSSMNDDLIRDLGFRKVRAMDLNQSIQFQTLTITAVPVKHWGPRVFIDRQRGYAGFLIESNQHKVLFGADTADGAHFDGLRSRGIDLAILGISAYDPYIAAHATPEQAWGMFQRMNARHLLPMHHSTFKLSYEPVDEPIKRLLSCAGTRVDKITVRQIGDSITS